MQQQILDDAKEIALKAGEVLMSYLGSKLKIEYKDDNFNNLVTEADKASEKIIIDFIKENYPDHDIVSEESHPEKINDDKKYRWIIDPLDGTNNFAHGHPHFAVSIGIEYQDEVVVGVVYCPFFKELFHAEKGKGAFLNNTPIKVSQAPTLKKSLVATGFPPTHREINIPHFERMLDHCQGLRRCGAAAIDLCYLACGRLDGFWEYGLYPWDIAAATLIIQEAGGHSTNIDGSPLDIYSRTIISSNSKIHPEIQNILS